MSGLNATKSWEVRRKHNRVRVAVAEEATRALQSRERERARQLARERELEKLAGPSVSVSFLYDAPEAEPEKGEGVDEKEEGEKRLTMAEKFPFLQGAPLARGVDPSLRANVVAKPFGRVVRNTQCRLCGGWGHRKGERECPRFGEPDEARLRAEDPVPAAAAPAAAPAAPPPEQAFLDSLSAEDLARLERAYRRKRRKGEKKGKKRKKEKRRRRE